MSEPRGPRDQSPKLPRADHLKAAINPAVFYAAELPDAPRLKAGREDWTQNIKCPFHEDPNPSFGVNLRTGAFRCFGCEAKGGSLIDFAMMRDGLTFDQARASLAERYHVEPGTAPAAPPRQSPKRPSTPRPQPAVAIAPEALKTRPDAHPKHGKPSAVWTYNDADGRPLAYVLRFDPPKGRKVFAPLTWTAADGWQWKAPPAPRPLYRLDALAARPDAPVCICEGEKAADAAAELLPGMATTATMNGAQAPSKSDLSLLKGRRVLIWPDADEPGTQYAEAVASIAHLNGAESVAILDLSSIAERPAHD